jgi:hypothetical protein
MPHRAAFLLPISMPLLAIKRVTVEQPIFAILATTISLSLMWCSPATSKPYPIYHPFFTSIQFRDTVLAVFAIKIYGLVVLGSLFCGR